MFGLDYDIASETKPKYRKKPQKKKNKKKNKKKKNQKKTNNEEGDHTRVEILLISQNLRQDSITKSVHKWIILREQGQHSADDIIEQRRRRRTTHRVENLVERRE
jgi:hypothetical protein